MCEGYLQALKVADVPLESQLRCGGASNSAAAGASSSSSKVPCQKWAHRSRTYSEDAVCVCFSWVLQGAAPPSPDTELVTEAMAIKQVPDCTCCC